MQERHERTDENVNQAFKDLDALIEKVTKINVSPLTLIFDDVNLKSYFDTSLWCLKRFYEGLEDLHKTF